MTTAATIVSSSAGKTPLWTQLLWRQNTTGL
jgi:hypothetical protein